MLIISPWKALSQYSVFRLKKSHFYLQGRPRELQAGWSASPWSLGRDHKTGRSGWYTQQPCCHPEKPLQVREMSQQEPQKTQAGEMWSHGPGEGQAQALVCAGGRPIGKQLCRKGHGFPVDTKLNMSQQWALVAKSWTMSWAALDKVLTADEGRWSCPLYWGIEEATPGMTGSVLVSQIQERHGHTRESAAKGYQNHFHMEKRRL